LTTVYTLGDLVAGNSTTSASAVPLNFATANGSAVTIADATLSVRRCKIKKTPRRSGCPRSACTCSRATQGASTGIVNGDGVVYITQGSATRSNLVPTTGNIFGLLEARRLRADQRLDLRGDARSLPVVRQCAASTTFPELRTGHRGVLPGRRRRRRRHTDD
jgi:hypothetical protein